MYVRIICRKREVRTNRKPWTYLIQINCQWKTKVTKQTIKENRVNRAKTCENSHDQVIYCMSNTTKQMFRVTGSWPLVTFQYLRRWGCQAFPWLYQSLCSSLRGALYSVIFCHIKVNTESFVLWPLLNN